MWQKLIQFLIGTTDELFIHALLKVFEKKTGDATEKATELIIRETMERGEHIKEGLMVLRTKLDAASLRVFDKYYASLKGDDERETILENAVGDTWKSAKDGLITLGETEEEVVDPTNPKKKTTTKGIPKWVPGYSPSHIFKDFWTKACKDTETLERVVRQVHQTSPAGRLHDKTKKAVNWFVRGKGRIIWMTILGAWFVFAIWNTIWSYLLLEDLVTGVPTEPLSLIRWALHSLMVWGVVAFLFKGRLLRFFFWFTGTALAVGLYNQVFEAGNHPLALPIAMVAIAFLVWEALKAASTGTKTHPKLALFAMVVLAIATVPMLWDRAGDMWHWSRAKADTFSPSANFDHETGKARVCVAMLDNGMPDRDRGLIHCTPSPNKPGFGFDVVTGRRLRAATLEEIEALSPKPEPKATAAKRTGFSLPFVFASSDADEKKKDRSDEKIRLTAVHPERPFDLEDGETSARYSANGSTDFGWKIENGCGTVIINNHRRIKRCVTDAPIADLRAPQADGEPLLGTHEYLWSYQFQATDGPFSGFATSVWK